MLQPSKCIYLLSRQIDKDCELMEQEGVMDYSLLLGIHFKNVSPYGDVMLSGYQTSTGKFPIPNETG